MIWDAICTCLNAFVCATEEVGHRQECLHCTGPSSWWSKLILRPQIIRVYWSVCLQVFTGNTGLILGLRPANERRRYFVTTSLSGWVQADEFPAQRPVTWSFDVFFDLRLNKRLSKQSRRWWFETPSHPLWRHSNEKVPHNCLSLHMSIRLCVQQKRLDITKNVFIVQLLRLDGVKSFYDLI